MAGSLPGLKAAQGVGELTMVAYGLAAGRRDMLCEVPEEIHRMQIVEFCPLPGAVADLPGSLKGIPDRLKGEMKHLFNLLVKDGYVRLKPTVKELHISLEPGRLPALKRFLETGELPPGRVGEALRGDHDPELSARP